MKIDTLILGGGGTTGISYIGIFQALFQNNIIRPDLQGITHIIGISAGALFSVPLLLQMNLSACLSLMEQFNMNELLNKDDIHINNILTNLGLFKNDMIGTFITSICKYTIHKEEITLQELYDLTKIKLSIKVCNITREQIEYINYETHPTMNLSILIQMTTCIPLFFEPIIYNGEQYVDGGTKSSYSIDYSSSKDYLGINLNGTYFKHESPLIQFCNSLFSFNELSLDLINYRTFSYVFENVITEFDMTQETKQTLIQNAYKKTLEHINAIPTEND